MLLTPHTFVGIAIGASVNDPVLAPILSFGMHFLGDLVPHWDFFSNTDKEQRRKGWRPIAVMLDLAFGVAVGVASVLYALWVLKMPSMALTILICCLTSVLPDILEAPYIYSSKDPFPFITGVQRKMQFQAKLPWGVLTQLLVIGVSLLVISNSMLR
ncbi:MAG: hypothetical protein WC243_00700 [Patescibacteria group bacterium]|jgi:hypothetical protein